MKPEVSTQLTLYSYWRSSAAYRVRIALHLKGLDFTTIPVHLVRNGGEQNAESYRLVNPQGLVPVLEHEGRVLTQSMAICEYLDECFEPYPLLPADPLGVHGFDPWCYRLPVRFILSITFACKNS